MIQSTEQPEALRLAGELEQFAYNLAQQSARELRRLHARVQELEAEMSEQCRIIGASSERELHLLARIDDLEASQARVPLSDEAVRHIEALTEIARMPNAEYVADAHNNAVRYLRGITQEKQG